MKLATCWRSIGILAVTLCASSAWAANSPLYDSWASHGVGTSVQVKKMIETAGHTMEMDITYTLSAVTPEKVTVDVKTVMNVAGRSIDRPSQPLEISADASASAAPGHPTGGKAPAGTEVTRGEETLTIDGKPYKCMVIDVTTEAAGMKIHAKRWQSKDVPNMAVKVQTTTEGARASSGSEEVVKVDLK